VPTPPRSRHADLPFDWVSGTTLGGDNDWFVDMRGLVDKRYFSAPA